MALEVIAEPLKSMAMLLVEVCAYAGIFLSQLSKWKDRGIKERQIDRQSNVILLTRFALSQNDQWQ